MKKLFSLLLTLALIGSSLHFSQSTQAFASSFYDVPDDHEYLEAIEYLKQEGIVEGHPPKEKGGERAYEPDHRLSRAALVKIIAEAKWDQETIDNCLQREKDKGATTMRFSDVPIDHWAAGPLCVANGNKILEGYPDGTARLDQPVSFVEAAKMIVSAGWFYRNPGEYNPNEAWFLEHLRALEPKNAIPKSIRALDKKITRGEMAQMIYSGLQDNDQIGLSVTKLTERSRTHDELPQIDSCDALIEKLGSKNQGTFGYLEMDAVSTATGATPPPSPAPRALKSIPLAESTASESAVSDDFSTTNIQVQGVDEADIIKNDGKYIYLIKGKTIRIVDAFPGTDMEEISTIELDDDSFQPREIYIDDDQMVIIGQTHRNRHSREPFSFIPKAKASLSIHPYYNNRMKVYIYDISNRKRPRKQRSIEIEGNYTNSRKVGKNVYFVLNESPRYYFENDDLVGDLLPMYQDSAEQNERKPLTRCTGVRYFPHLQDHQYLIVAGINIANSNSKLNRKVYLGSSQNIYASKESLYVATHRYQPVERQDGDDLYYGSESGTLVYRFKLNEDEIEYQNRASVPGTILNQFSMDEYKGHFRIATTRGNIWDERNKSTNNLYIFDRGSMERTGEIENIAPGERIYSVRFMGKKAYMVTFKKVDPLFVIDVSNPHRPKILGELKIPGFSDYLHPFDEDHIIGFGKDTVEASDDMKEDRNLDFAWYQGIKIALFDVSDVNNPKQKFVELIGDRGTESELLHNHRALLFDHDKKLLALPVTVHEVEDKENAAPNAYGEPVFQGAYVYTLDKNDGFSLRGKVTHFEDNSAFENNNLWQHQGRFIKRLLYIGDYLYSVSEDYVRSYDLDSTDSVSFIKLTGGQDDGVNYLED